MSVLPFFSGHRWYENRDPFEPYDQPYGGGMHLGDLMRPFQGHAMACHQPWSHFPGQGNVTSDVHLDKDGFSVSLDVKHFAPEEISVKHVGNDVVVEGKHEEYPDEHGFITRQFVRRYILPDTVNTDALTSTLSSDGVLFISAPKVLPDDGKGHTIPIQRTGQPAIRLRRKHSSTVIATGENTAKN